MWRFACQYPAKNICVTIIQCWANVEDVVPMLYICYTNVLCFLGTTWFRQRSDCVWRNTYAMATSKHYVVYCSASVADIGPTLNRHCVSVSCLLCNSSILFHTLLRCVMRESHNNRIENDLKKSLVLVALCSILTFILPRSPLDFLIHGNLAMLTQLVT